MDRKSKNQIRLAAVNLIEACEWLSRHWPRRGLSRALIKMALPSALLGNFEKNLDTYMSNPKARREWLLDQLISIHETEESAE